MMKLDTERRLPLYYIDIVFFSEVNQYKRYIYAGAKQLTPVEVNKQLMVLY